MEPRAFLFSLAGVLYPLSIFRISLLLSFYSCGCCLLIFLKVVFEASPVREWKALAEVEREGSTFSMHSMYTLYSSYNTPAHSLD